MNANLRTAYGKTLVALGGEIKDIVVLEADLSKSTMGALFEEAFPNRFFEMGIAEADMAGVAAGLALTGKIPFMATFAVFAPGRCYDQIRTGVCIPKLNVKICGSSAGLSDFGDGSTHQSIDDIALMRVLPNMQVFSPADAVEAAQIVRYMANHFGPMYIRICRNDLPVLTEEDREFIPGRIYPLREGGDVAIFATGVTVSIALKAAEALAGKGIEAAVINTPSIKPLDAEAVREVCRNTRAVVTAEEHSVYGGLGDAVSMAISPVLARKHIRVGMQDTFGTSAENYQVLLEHFGFTPETIVEAAEKALN
jgi:transketolase